MDTSRTGASRDNEARRTPARVVLLSVVALLVLSADGVAAQCRLQVRPQPGSAGYQQRDHGCEGMYVGLQSSLLAGQVISLTRGPLGYRLGAGDTLEVHVPTRLDGLEQEVEIVGRAREANLNWGLDGIAAPGQPMLWHLGEVIDTVSLGPERIGVFGRTRAAGSLGHTVYVPVDIRRREEIHAPWDSFQLVVLLPSAGSAEWRIGSDGPYERATALNGDGYFLIEIPRSSPQSRAGEVTLEITWKTRGDRLPAPYPEVLRIYHW